MNISLIPDYICYNSSMCHGISPTYFYLNFTSIQSSQLELASN